MNLYRMSLIMILYLYYLLKSLKIIKKSNTEKVTKAVSDTTKNAVDATKSFLGF